MKRIIRYTLLLSASLCLFWGCAAGRQGRETVSVTPSPYILAQDSTGCVRLDMFFHIPGKYFSRRSRLVITPQLVVGDTVRDVYAPLVVNAPIYSKKEERREKLSGSMEQYSNNSINVNRVSTPLSLAYSEMLALPKGMDNGYIMAVVSTDGCGECTGIDTIEIASISNPITLMPSVKEALELSWMEPEFVVRPKIVQGKGTANLQFSINRNDINLTLGNNRNELENMVSILSPILSDTLATLNSLAITGMASADGSFAFNTTLARNRAIAARHWIVSRLKVSPETQRRISVDSRPEGWEPVLAAMVADENPDSVAVKAILEKYAGSNDDVQEYHIRRLSVWNQIKNKYLQKDRKVEYVYTYTMRNFISDEELSYMYGKRPDAFNEDELLRVASLAVTHGRKKEVYRTIMEYFPQSQVAANNLAVLYLCEGKAEKAREVLSRLDKHSPEVLNTLAASYVYTNDYERAIELIEDTELPEARYNLGLLKAKQRRLEEAYVLLRPFGDLNSAICALSVNENSEAQEILSSLALKTPVAEYARSLAAARLGEDEVFFRHIGNACSDPGLRRRAVTEPDFRRYHGNSLFCTLTDK